MRGSCWPGALFASNTPGTEVVLMAMLPVLATTVPGAGLPAAGLSPAPAEAAALEPGLCGAAPALLSPLAALAPGLDVPLAGGALMALDLPADAAPPAGVMD